MLTVEKSYILKYNRGRSIQDRDIPDVQPFIPMGEEEQREKRDVDTESNNNKDDGHDNIEMQNDVQNALKQDAIEVQHIDNEISDWKAGNGQDQSEPEKTINKTLERQVESMPNQNPDNNSEKRHSDISDDVIKDVIPENQKDDHINPAGQHESNQEVSRDKMLMETSEQKLESLHYQNQGGKAEVKQSKLDQHAPGYGVQDKKVYDFPYKYDTEMIDEVERKIYLVERVLRKLSEHAQKKIFQPPEHDKKFGCNIYVYMMKFKRPTVHDVWKGKVR